MNRRLVEMIRDMSDKGQEDWAKKFESVIDGQIIEWITKEAKDGKFSFTLIQDNGVVDIPPHVVDLFSRILKKKLEGFSIHRTWRRPGLGNSWTISWGHDKAPERPPSKKG